MSAIWLRMKNLVKPLKLHDYKVRRGTIDPKKYLSETGASIFDLMENADFWTVTEHTLNHASGLELWISNGQNYFDIWRMPNGDYVRGQKMLSGMDRFILWQQAERLQNFLRYEAQRKTSDYLRSMKT